MGRHLIFVAIGGMIGCVGRFLIVTALAGVIPISLPVGTLLVNVVGSFIIGLGVGLADTHDWLHQDWKIFITAGFCGGFTTFSAFALENVQLLLEKSYGTFALYSILSFALTLAAVFAGLTLAER